MCLSRFSHIFTALRASTLHVRGRAQTRKAPSGGCAGTGKTCTQVHLLPAGLRGNGAGKGAARPANVSQSQAG